MSYNVLLIGSGGREHALAYKISQSQNLSKFYALPGNPGIAKYAECISGGVNDFDLIKEVIKEREINMVVVGPEDPLVNGLRNYLFEDESLSELLFIGPDKAGAALEGSKDFAKAFMTKYDIPTAAYRSFSAGEIEDAVAFLKTLKPPYVLKADGLAAGKGVLILSDIVEAENELGQMFSGKFGAAGNKVVIEEFLSGVEVSFFVLTDGKEYLLLPEAKDYKRIGDNDQGLNTGGMGAVSPVPFANDEFVQKVKSRIVEPTIAGLRAEGIDYRGFIFIGLMNCGGDPFVIEYNVRMGDPETEVVMPRIKSDLLSHLAAAAKGNLAGESFEVYDKSAMTVIMVSGGYPENYAKGYEITGLDNVDSDIIVFNSGTKLSDEKLVTSGGRVLAVTTLGESLVSTREHIYDNLKKISFKDSYNRSDIGLDMIHYK